MTLITIVRYLKQELVGGRRRSVYPAAASACPSSGLRKLDLVATQTSTVHNCVTTTTPFPLSLFDPALFLSPTTLGAAFAMGAAAPASSVDKS